MSTRITEGYKYAYVASATTTQVKTGNGILKAIVVNTTAAGAISIIDGTSGSTVKVYKSTGLVRTYNSGPGQAGRWWQIFCFDKATKNITDVGQAGCSASSFFNAAQN